jgi:alanyl-tRNA synthetase
MELGRSLATSEIDERALRILADHSRGMTFLIADGVVPSNEDRGYVLRRLMRRAIQQGHKLGIEHGFLPRYVDVVIETMGRAYPELISERSRIVKWVESEEAGFGRTLEQGLKLLEEHIRNGTLDERVAFQLHDTFGFPFEMTREIAAEHGVHVDEGGFEILMDEQRRRSAGGARTIAKVATESFGPETEFVGYEQLEAETTAFVAERDGQLLVKLETSPFYAQGGGQISDEGVVVCADGDCTARVVDVLPDRTLVVEAIEGALQDGEAVVAEVDRPRRHATACNHTATHLLHAALRRRLGDHVRQAGSYVGPDKLRFDFTHTQRLSEEERADIERQVNDWILSNHPVHALTTSLEEAKRLGAMALFGEKYGDVVRMVEVADGSFSRELCGGTHVRSTAEIGVFKLLSEGSSASNVRRIEAVTGPEAVGLLRAHDELLGEVADALRVPPEKAVEAIEKLRAASKKAATASQVDPATYAEQAVRLANGQLLAIEVDRVPPKELPRLADQIRGRLGEDAAVVLGTKDDGKVALVAAVSQPLVALGVKAGDIVRVAAQVAGGGGGGKDTMAQAGGRDPEKLDEALAAARAAVEAALG